MGRTHRRPRQRHGLDHGHWTVGLGGLCSPFTSNDPRETSFRHTHDYDPRERSNESDSVISGYGRAAAVSALAVGLHPYGSGKYHLLPILPGELFVLGFQAARRLSECSRVAWHRWEI